MFTGNRKLAIQCEQSGQLRNSRQISSHTGLKSATVEVKMLRGDIKKQSCEMLSMIGPCVGYRDEFISKHPYLRH